VKDFPSRWKQNPNRLGRNFKGNGKKSPRIFLGNYILDVGNPVCHSPAADPKSAGAPAEIEVTPAMIEAGYEVLRDNSHDDGISVYRYADIVSEMYIVIRSIEKRVS
jgi:hypothetical protein